ncbi:MAG: thiamine-phosphate kinase [Thermoplasmata archaeon]
MPELCQSGERKIVADIIRKFDPSGEINIGDDSAILDIGFNYLLLTTDMITRSTHIPEGARPEDIGWYAAAVNLSDIAAMGGEPLGMLFALGLPPDTDSEWLDALTDGIQECCSAHGAPVLGGDTKENPEMTISGTAIGKVRKDRILRRNGARPGDVLAMTGALGRGLAWEKQKSRAESLLRVIPRLDVGKALAASDAATSCIDMSDGLSSSLHILSRASNVGFILGAASLPLMPGIEPGEKEEAMHWGGDFELLFTLNPDKARKVLSMGLGITRIGEVTEGTAILLDDKGAASLIPDKGYEHFGRMD